MGLIEKEGGGNAHFICSWLCYAQQREGWQVLEEEGQNEDRKFNSS